MVCTLLIVDDEPKIYHALRRSLHREPNWRTLYAAGGAQALEIVAAEDVDVAIVDENMPGMSGSELLKSMRAEHPDVIRMMLTGDPRVDLIMDAVNCGEIYRFFTKPCNEAELVAAIHDSLRMRGLKQESTRLLEKFKQQEQLISELKAQLEHVPAGAADDARDEPQMVGSTQTVASEVMKLGGDNEVDTLLHAIRSQLDSMVS